LKRIDIMVVRRRIASAYEDGAKKRVKQYGTIIGVFLVVMYVLTSGSNENEAVNDIRPLRSKSKINSFSGPYEKQPIQQQQQQQQQHQQSQQIPPPMIQQEHQHQQMYERSPPMEKESVDESIKGAEHELEMVGHKELIKGQQEILEKTLQAASGSLRQNPRNIEDIDPKTIENAVALRLEEEASAKLEKITDNLIHEKESVLSQVVDQDKAEGMNEKEIIEDVSLIEEMSIKELKQEISDEVQDIEKGLQKEASKIESQVLKETLGRIEQQKELDKATATGAHEQHHENDETEDKDSEKVVEVINEEEFVEDTSNNEVEEKSKKIISLVDPKEDSKEIIDSGDGSEQQENVVVHNVEEKNEEDGDKDKEKTVDLNIEAKEKTKKSKHKGKIIDLNIEDKNEEITDHKKKESKQKEKIIDLNLEDKNEDTKSVEED